MEWDTSAQRHNFHCWELLENMREMAASKELALMLWNHGNLQ